ncbi:putative phytosulfokines 6 [Syzygium oleosum]|uniref:putative phytosulfokines 6 n=1 Tax=Syzygium oleosum TaxID=219896 RepID=UPI0011D25BE9|nr:putative phytosulfokines 6 [Syzygium oleosum]
MKAAARGLASILLVAFLLFSSSFARPLSTATQVVLSGVKPEEADGNLVAEATDLLNLMGMESDESCGDQDEECLKRRMIADAHLDYIYTQNHKP